MTRSPIITQRTGPESSSRASDVVLLDAIAAGDRRAFGQLYRQHAGATFRVAHGVLRDPDQAEEVTQEVFLSIWRNAARFDPTRGSVSRYIATMAHSKSVDRVRASQAARRRDERYCTSNVDGSGSQDPVFDDAQLRAEHSEIRSALAGLTAIQREAIRLFYFEPCTYSEAAVRLGVPVATVKARIQSGVGRLRSQFVDRRR